MTEAKDIGHEARLKKQQYLRETSPATRLDADGKLTLHKRELDIGKEMQDGTLYAGEVNGKRIYATPTDYGGLGKMIGLVFNQAARYVDELNEKNYLGHNDWRLPDIEELDLLCKAKKEGSFKKTFTISSYTDTDDLADVNYEYGCYWSSSRAPNVGTDYLLGKQFVTEEQLYIHKYFKLNVRAIRG